ncbi:MAG TPA: aspartate dehydrogenase [Steroidobacteraceae bacterium]|nr:aspartate dehydrogenase [Steroidobacteraceae bacterium]
MRGKSVLRVAVGGLGAIGTAIVGTLDAGVPGLELRAVSARDIVKARERLGGLRAKPAFVPLTELAALADVIVECAPAAVYDDVAGPAIEAGRILVTMSTGALLSRESLIRRAEQTGARIVIPSGGILGLDALRAAAEGEIHSVTLITKKPPRSLAGANYLLEKNISVLNLKSPVLIFQGNAREAALAFPANANVAATLSLAGIGPTRTRVEIWADPAIETNVQELRVRADSADFDIKLSSHPLPENPRTGSLTPKSAIAALRSLVSPLTIGG